MTANTSAEDFSIALADGLVMRGVVRKSGADATDNSGRAPIICLPGLTRNERDFAGVADYLAARGHTVWAVSLRGRGSSDYDPERLNYHPLQYVSDVETMMDQLELSHSIFLGTSLGGIITMLLAQKAPLRVRAAVINDVGPDLAPEGLARIGAYVAARASTEVEHLTFEDAIAACRADNEIAFPDRDDAFWADFARRIYREETSGWRLDYDLEIAAALAEVGPAPDLWPGFKALAGAAPTLVIRGSLSDLLTPDIVAKMKAEAPSLQTAEVANVGHAPMLDEPEAQAAIDRFLGQFG